MSPRSNENLLAKYSFPYTQQSNFELRAAVRRRGTPPTAFPPLEGLAFTGLHNVEVVLVALAFGKDCKLVHWLQYCLDVLTREHVFKAIFPLLYSGDAADDEIEIDLASRDHVNHTLPNGPVV